MEGIFFIEMIPQKSDTLGPNARLKMYLQKKGVNIKDTSIKISACKGGDNRTTAISLKDVLDEKMTTYYLGLTKDTDTLKRDEWDVYELNRCELAAGLRKRYNVEKLSDLSDESGKNYRINVGRSYVQNADNKCKKREDLSNAGVQNAE